MCWFHKWAYWGKYLRTCQKCGIHQHFDYPDDAVGEWFTTDCKYFEELVEGWKQKQYEEAVKQGKLRKEQLECKHYNHKDNKPKVRMMPSMMVIRKKTKK